MLRALRPHAPPPLRSLPRAAASSGEDADTLWPSRTAPPPPQSAASTRSRRGESRARPSDADSSPRLSRSLLANKTVITRATGASLGVVTELWVDTVDWAVLSLELRPNLLSGEGRCCDLQELRSVGDVCLVQDDRALERTGWTPPGCTGLVGKDLVTETGEYLGKIRDYDFDPRSGELRRLLFDAFGLPFLPPSLVSVYALSVGKRVFTNGEEEPQTKGGDIVSLGPDRVVARAGSERRVLQLSASLLQRLQLAEPPWEEALRFGSEPQQEPLGRDGARGGGASSGSNAFEAAMEARAARERAAGGADRGQEGRGRAPAREGIPLVRPSVPYERRDADGGYGAPPPPPPPPVERRRRSAAALSDGAATPAYDQWAPQERSSARERREEEEVEEVEMAGGDGWERGERADAKPPSRARPEDYL